MLTKDQALCLRTVSFSETSQVVTLLGRRTGKFSALAKGSRRAKSAFDGPIEVLSCGEIVFVPSPSNTLATLTEFQQQPRFHVLRGDLYGTNNALLAVELTAALTHDYDPHPDLYDRLVTFLDGLQSSRAPAEMLGLLILFELALLRDIGMQPVLSRCANCGSAFGKGWARSYFSSAANGLVCPDCEQAFTEKKGVSRSSAAVLADLSRIRNAGSKALLELENVLIHHFTELLHRPPKMAKHVLVLPDR